MILSVSLLIVFFIITIIWLLKHILKCFSPKINNSNVKTIGKKCIKLLDIKKNKKIKFRIEDNLKESFTEVVKKYESYIIHIKNTDKEKRVSTLIHELSHIKNGESDRFKDFDLSFVLKYILNFIFDTFSANPNEIKYFLKTKKI